jgi:hypothetical protein
MKKQVDDIISLFYYFPLNISIFFVTANVACATCRVHCNRCSVIYNRTLNTRLSALCTYVETAPLFLSLHDL